MRVPAMPSVEWPYNLNIIVLWELQMAYENQRRLDDYDAPEHQADCSDLYPELRRIKSEQLTLEHRMGPFGRGVPKRVYRFGADQRPSTSRFVVVKDQTRVEGFDSRAVLEEAHIQHELRGPGITEIYGVVDEPGFKGIVSAYSSGDTLEYHNSRMLRLYYKHERNRPRTLAEVNIELMKQQIDLLTQLAQVMRDVAERKVVLGDLQADHIMVLCQQPSVEYLLDDGEVYASSRPTFELRITDFGHASFVDDNGCAGVNLTWRRLGATYIQPPENLRCVLEYEPGQNQPILLTVKGGVFRAGVLFYEVLGFFQMPYPDAHTGAMAITNGQKPRDPGCIPQSLLEIIWECMALDPEDRPSWEGIIGKLTAAKPLAVAEVTQAKELAANQPQQ